MHAVPTHAASPERLPFYRQLYFQVVVAIVAGVLLGHFEPQYAEQFKPLGDAFIKLVKMIIAPVIFLTIVTGIAGMTHLRTVGRVFLKAMAYFLFLDRKSTRLNSSHLVISYAVFCLKKNTNQT